MSVTSALQITVGKDPLEELRRQVQREKAAEALYGHASHRANRLGLPGFQSFLAAGEAEELHHAQEISELLSDLYGEAPDQSTDSSLLRDFSDQSIRGIMEALLDVERAFLEVFGRLVVETLRGHHELHPISQQFLGEQVASVRNLQTILDILGDAESRADLLAVDRIVGDMKP